MSKKSRKLIRAGVVADQPPEPAVAPEPAWDFYFLPESEPAEVDEAELHEQIKLWRHGRATRTAWEVIQDGYVAIFSVVMLGAMAFSVIQKAQTGAATCATAACGTARLLMPAAMVFAGLALTLAIARLFGPVLASAAEGFWLMDAPISRRRLLGGRLRLPVVLAGLVLALLTALVGALVGMGVVPIVVWSVTAGLGAAALMALAAVEQARERTWLVRALLWVFGVATVAVLLVVVSVAAGWLQVAEVPSGPVADVVVAGIGVGALVALVLGLLAAGRRLESIRRARLLSGGSLVSGMQGAMFALDFGLIRDILVEREAAARGHVRPTTGHGLGVSALIWRDVERLKRSPKPWIGLALSLVVPYAADGLRMSQLNPLLSGLALFVALVPFLGSLRVLTRTGGLARMLPFKTSTIRTAVMAVPAVLALVWAAVAAPAFIGISQTGADRSLVDGWVVSLATAVAGLFGAVRWQTAKKVDFGVPMMATSSGAMPPTLLFNLFRGFDMVALITAPLILNLPVTASLGIAAVVFVFLRGTFNMDELKAEQAALQREEAAKKAGTGQKVKVPPPRR